MTLDILTLLIQTSLDNLKSNQLLRLLTNSNQLIINKLEVSSDPLKTRVLNWYQIWLEKSTQRNLILRNKLMFKDLGYTLKTQVWELSTKAKVEKTNYFLLIMPIHCRWEMECGQFILNQINQHSIEEWDKTWQSLRIMWLRENDWKWMNLREIFQF
jgi:hypothetical protein